MIFGPSFVRIIVHVPGMLGLLRPQYVFAFGNFLNIALAIPAAEVVMQFV